MDIPGDGDASDDENMVRDEGDIVLTDNETDSEVESDNSEEFFEPPQPSTLRRRGRGRGGRSRGGRRANLGPDSSNSKIISFIIFSIQLPSHTYQTHRHYNDL